MKHPESWGTIYTEKRILYGFYETMACKPTDNSRYLNIICDIRSCSQRLFHLSPPRKGHVIRAISSCVLQLQYPHHVSCSLDVSISTLAICFSARCAQSHAPTPPHHPISCSLIFRAQHRSAYSNSGISESHGVHVAL
jgi:hypothetical protein